MKGKILKIFSHNESEVFANSADFVSVLWDSGTVSAIGFDRLPFW
jgi:hypothetical protein